MSKFTKDSYKTLIPKKLHWQLDQLIDYLDFFPFEKPSYCHYCDSTHIYATGHYSRPNKQLPQYYCTDCKRDFNQLTNTIFARTWHLEQWGLIGRLHLAGLSAKQASQQTTVSIRGVQFRFKAINKLMQAEYPELYNWWHKHREREDISFSDKPDKQATFFFNWLEEIITKQDYNCPHCNKQLYKDDYKSLRPQFVCYHCKYYFNPLNATRLKRMHRIDLWLPYAKGLCDGYSDTDIEKLTGVHLRMTRRWRAMFIKQMQDLQLDELIQWLTWQRQRRHVQSIKISKWLTNY